MENLTQFAADHAGNWETWECFYSGVEELRGMGWAIVYTSRGGADDLLDESNAAVIEKRLRPFLDADPDGHYIREYSASHWICNSVSGYLIKVYDDNGITPAFSEWWEIKCELKDYPILDEDDFSTRESEACWEAYTYEINHLDLVDAGGAGVALTEEQLSEVYSHCDFDYANNYPNSEDIHHMITQLYEYYDRDSWESSQQ